ncbi:stage III sporulation protein AE [Vallitalea okinawensis]|uniref:stage III sporulation protein AE n=1 Tax=Vallitalea okinawensis TaxID=2078660 RepID=UPI000CFBC1C9|nr:stage III sporulation protein AE [Vallitalea okinawensis]
MRHTRWIILIILFLSCFSIEANASDIDTILEEQMAIIDFEEIDAVLGQDYIWDYFNVANFQELLTQLIKGELDFSLISFMEHFLNTFLKELNALGILMGEIIVLAVMSQILKNIDVSFKKTAVGEMGFYVVYVTLILILFKSFDVVIDLVTGTINELYALMESILPTMLMLVMVSGNITAGTAQGTAVLFTLEVLVNIIKTYILPIIYFIVILELINNISKQDILSHLLSFVKVVINKALKYTIVVFSLIMSVTNIIPNMVDGIINKGAKYAMSSIPVVGTALSGVVDTVLNCSVLIKNSVGIGAIIIILIMCIIPVIKLLAIYFIYKISASLVQPLADERIVKGLSGIGDYSGMLLGVLITVMVLFIASITILVTTTNMTMMMR